MRREGEDEGGEDAGKEREAGAEGGSMPARAPLKHHHHQATPPHTNTNTNHHHQKGFAELACGDPTRPYVRPTILPDSAPEEVVLERCRHPCVEAQEGVAFVANDCRCGVLCLLCTLCLCCARCASALRALALALLACPRACLWLLYSSLSPVAHAYLRPLLRGLTIHNNN